MKKMALIAALSTLPLALAACGGETTAGESADTPAVGSATESDAVATGAPANGAADAAAMNVEAANSQ